MSLSSSSQVGLLVTGGAAGHKWGCWSQVGLLVTCGAAGHRWGCWSQVGLLVTGEAAGHRWGCWSQVVLLVTGGAAGHRWGCWSQVGLLVTGGAAGHGVPSPLPSPPPSPPHDDRRCTRKQSRPGWGGGLTGRGRGECDGQSRRRSGWGDRRCSSGRHWRSPITPIPSSLLPPQRSAATPIPSSLSPPQRPPGRRARCRVALAAVDGANAIAGRWRIRWRVAGGGSAGVRHSVCRARRTKSCDEAGNDDAMGRRQGAAQAAGKKKRKVRISRHEL
ncbi:unnamed protein product [Closterium sp. NIES-64]|nr:unnamed protein product [Closterium sp. NIES-64]